MIPIGAKATAKSSSIRAQRIMTTTFRGLRMGNSNELLGLVLPEVVVVVAFLGVGIGLSESIEQPWLIVGIVLDPLRLEPLQCSCIVGVPTGWAAHSDAPLTLPTIAVLSITPHDVGQ